MSVRSRASASRARASSARLERRSVSATSEGLIWEDMIWEDMADSSREGPAGRRLQLFRRIARSRSGRPVRARRGLDPPPCPLPKGIAQPPLEDLAGILARQIAVDFDVFRHLVIGKRDLEPGADVRDVEHHAGLRLH